MRAATSRFRFSAIAAVCGLFLSFAAHDMVIAAAPSAGIEAYLQNRLGLNPVQVRGALGALLVYARDRLPKPEFDELTARFPNAANMMEDVKLRGIVTRPMDDIEAYETALEATLQIPKPVAAQLVQGVLDYFGQAGYAHEQDLLYRVVH